MKAEYFNQQIETILSPILLEAGFVPSNRHFVLVKDERQVVLLRYGGSKFANVCQFTRFMLGVRHTFLRDVWEKLPDGIPDQLSAFPFRIRPSELHSDAWRSWEYGFKLNPNEYDEIEYGRIDDATTIIRRLGEAIADRGLQWSEQFDLRKSLHMINQYGEGAFIEQLWIEDYNRKLDEES